MAFVPACHPANMGIPPLSEQPPLPTAPAYMPRVSRRRPTLGEQVNALRSGTTGPVQRWSSFRYRQSTTFPVLVTEQLTVLDPGHVRPAIKIRTSLRTGRFAGPELGKDPSFLIVATPAPPAVNLRGLHRSKVYGT
jgi:hypothetical protein